MTHAANAQFPSSTTSHPSIPKDTNRRIHQRPTPSHPVEPTTKPDPHLRPDLQLPDLHPSSLPQYSTHTTPPSAPLTTLTLSPPTTIHSNPKTHEPVTILSDTLARPPSHIPTPYPAPSQSPLKHDNNSTHHKTLSLTLLDSLFYPSARTLLTQPITPPTTPLRLALQTNHPTRIYNSHTLSAPPDSHHRPLHKPRPSWTSLTRNPPSIPSITLMCTHTTSPYSNHQLPYSAPHPRPPPHLLPRLHPSPVSSSFPLFSSTPPPPSLHTKPISPGKSPQHTNHQHLPQRHRATNPKNSTRATPHHAHQTAPRNYHLHHSATTIPPPEPPPQQGSLHGYHEFRPARDSY